MTTLQQIQRDDDQRVDRKKKCEYETESNDKREREKEKTPFRRNKNPFYTRVPFRPTFGGRFIRPRFMKNEQFFDRPGCSFRFQRHHPFAGVRTHQRSYKVADSPHLSTSQCARMNINGEDSKGIPKNQKNSLQSSVSLTQEKGKEHLSFTMYSNHVCPDPEESSDTQGHEAPVSVMRAAIRNRAIQQKRQEIEEVYRQDCATFGLVVKMLIAKDPSLEYPIQATLRKNLQEIGLRCAAAMQQFIDEYDLVHP